MKHHERPHQRCIGPAVRRRTRKTLLYATFRGRGKKVPSPHTGKTSFGFSFSAFSIPDSRCARRVSDRSTVAGVRAGSGEGELTAPVEGRGRHLAVLHYLGAAEKRESGTPERRLYYFSLLFSWFLFSGLFSPKFPFSQPEAASV